MSIRKTVSLGLVAVAFTGCSSYSSWVQIEQDAPWGKGHQKATTWKRTETPSSLMVVGAPLSEESWKTDGKLLRTCDVSKSITRYLNSIGYIDQQKLTNGYSDGIQERVAENRFFIVSLKPTVVVMTPYEVNSTKGRSGYELAGRLSKQVISSFPLINGYHFGGKVIRSPKYKWFSPDLKSGIQSASKEGSRWIIDNKNFRIVINPSTSKGWSLVDRQR